MIYILGRLFRYLWSAVSPCNEFCDRILSIPLLPRTIKLTAFILCLLLCVMKLIFSSQPFLLYSILKHKILFCLPYKNIYEFYGGRETNPEQVALVSFTSIVLYSIYDVRMTTGVVSAFLLFSQIIGSHDYYTSLKANTDLPFTISNIIISIYSITNLEFFRHEAFSYCLFSNAGSVDILAFKLLLSFYPIFLILTYFLLRRYCTCKHRFFQNCRLSSRSVTHGVSAFLVLCFARINILAFGILRHTELFYINGTSYKKMVHFQGNIEYFREPLYNVYAIGSLLAIVIIITIPTMILMLHPILINIAIYFEWGESKFVSLVNKLLLIHKLKPVLDTFQGDYKDKLHYFAGLHFFLYKIIFFVL